MEKFKSIFKKHRHHILSIVFSIALAGCGEVDSATTTPIENAPPGPTPTGDLIQLRCPGQSIIDLARSQPLIRFDRQLSGGAHSWWFHAGEMGLTATAACGDSQANARLLEQIRNILIPGQGLTSPAGYADQHQVGMLATFAIVSRIPSLWDQFSSSEKLKIELMLEAALVSNAFLTSDKNPFVQGAGPQRAIDGDFNVHRDWNPNYRNGNLGSVIVTAAHFGPTQAKAILKNHSHQDFITKLRQAGLDNLVETYDLSNDPTDAQIESTLHADYSYYGITLDQILDLYLALTNATYSATVNCGLNNGNGIIDSSGNRGGYIASNCNQLPHKGEMGMLGEFDSLDGNGPRSSAWYANDGLRPNTYIHYVIVALGYWQNTPESAETLTKMIIGAEDLFFKLDPGLGGGYFDYGKGSAGGLTQFDDKYGHRISKELGNLIFDYHGQ